MTSLCEACIAHVNALGADSKWQSRFTGWTKDEIQLGELWKDIRCSCIWCSSCGTRRFCGEHYLLLNWVMRWRLSQCNYWWLKWYI